MSRPCLCERRTSKLLVEPAAVATGDIAFNLIVFFLVCASTQPDSGRKQDLPRSEQTKTEQKNAEHRTGPDAHADRRAAQRRPGASCGELAAAAEAAAWKASRGPKTGWWSSRASPTCPTTTGSPSRRSCRTWGRASRFSAKKSGPSRSATEHHENRPQDQMKADVPSVAMGDIAFNLLIFFVILAQAQDDSHLQWQPAQAAEPARARGKPRSAWLIDNENKLYLNGQRDRPAAAGRRDRGSCWAMLPAGERTVLLKVHKDATAMYFEPVIEADQRGGRRSGSYSGREEVRGIAMVQTVQETDGVPCAACRAQGCATCTPTAPRRWRS